MSEKPVIFISHATTDNPIVDILKSQIDQVFANGVNVFASSVPGVIKPGRVWLDEIKSNLEMAKVVLVIVTPVSINRPWIWFEVGASWSKMEIGKGRIYPLCVPEIDFNDLPVPLNSLQALSLGKAKDIKLLFQELCSEFAFGNMKGFKSSTIISRLPKYTDLKISQIDLDSGQIYSGPYEGYTEQELSEIIDDYINMEFKIAMAELSELAKERNVKDPLLMLPFLSHNRSSFFSGKLIHYKQVDNQASLPAGTSKKLLKRQILGVSWTLNTGTSNVTVKAIPVKEMDNSIRFVLVEHEQLKSSTSNNK